MPILYSVVSRGTTVLAKYASCAGNFAEITEQVLGQIPAEGGKLTYSHGKYLFHYIAQDNIIFFCITDASFDRSKSFAFLSEVQQRFLTTYGQRALTALPYAMNSDFSMILSTEMKAFSNDKFSDKVGRVQNQVEDLRTIMVKNIDNIANRGERLELLIKRSDDLEASSHSFRGTSNALARQLCMKNAKITIICCLGVAVSQFRISLLTAIQQTVYNQT